MNTLSFINISAVSPDLPGQGSGGAVILFGLTDQGKVWRYEYSVNKDGGKWFPVNMEAGIELQDEEEQTKPESKENNENGKNKGIVTL